MKKSSAPYKEEKYSAALEDIIKKYSSYPITSLAYFNKANVYFNKANTYNTTNQNEYRYYHQKALDIINARLKVVNDASEGSKNLNTLKTYIERKTVAAQIENINLPNTPFRALVTYRKY
jgi:flagellin-specific chaperone FliS